MSASNSAYYGGSAGSKVQLIMTMQEISVDNANNRSLVRVWAYMHRVSSTSVYNNDPTYGNIVVDGVQYNGQVNGYNFGSGTDFYMFNAYDIWVYHNSDGTKTVYGSAYHDAANSPYLTTASVGSFSLVLTNIPKVPSVTSNDPTDLATTSVTGNGNVTWDGNSTILERGFAYGTSANPTIAGNKKTVSGTTGAFNGSITGLTPGVTYHYRAYATNAVGTTYGADKQFTMLKLPELTTDAATSIQGTSAVGNGTVTDVGNPNITQRGFVWGTSPNPTTAGSKVIASGTEAGGYTASMTGLSPATTYYYRSYAINSVGTAYGDEHQFTTVVAPSVTTNPATNVTTSSAIGNGEVTSAGGGTITERGFCYSLSANPTTSDSKVIVAGTLGEFSDTISGLSGSQTYHYRAYAINSGGTGYGVDRTFSTEETAPTQPTNLSPSGGIAVDDLTPTISWTYNPGSGNDAQSAYQVVVIRQSDSQEMWDSGKITSESTSIDIPGAANLAYDIIYQWKVRTYNQSDMVSPYSSLVVFKTSYTPTASITYPTDGGTITTSTPLVTWDFDDQGSSTQAKYQVKVFNADGSLLLHNSGLVSSSDEEYQVPENIIFNLEAYRITVQVTDSDGLESTIEISDFDVEYVAPTLPTLEVSQDDSGVVQLSSTLNSPMTDGWYSDRLGLYRKEVGSSDYVTLGTVDIEESILSDCEAITGWTKSGVATNVAVDDIAKYGTKSLKIGTSGAGDAIYSMSLAVTDLSNYDCIQAWLFITDTDNFSELELRFGVDSSNYFSVSKSAGDLVADTWNPIYVKIEDWDETGVTSADLLSLLEVHLNGATEAITAGDIKIDQIRLVKTSYLFNDHTGEVGKSYNYYLNSYSSEAEVYTGMTESSLVTIAFNELRINTYIVPIGDEVNTVKAWMDGSKVPSWNDTSDQKYYQTRGSDKPIVLVNSNIQYKEGSTELRFFDQEFDGQGLAGVDLLESIKNNKPLLLRTWWGRNYYISIDGDINTIRKSGIGWYASFTFTEINP